MYKSNIGKVVDQSKFKREYIEENLNISRNTLSNWCRSVSHPKAPQLFELAELLNVEVKEFYIKEED